MKLKNYDHENVQHYQIRHHRLRHRRCIQLLCSLCTPALLSPLVDVQHDYPVELHGYPPFLHAGEFSMLLRVNFLFCGPLTPNP